MYRFLCKALFSSRNYDAQVANGNNKSNMTLHLARKGIVGKKQDNARRVKDAV